MKQHHSIRTTIALAMLALVMLPLAASAATRRAVTPPASPAPAQASRYTPSQLEAYLSDDGIAYIRPGFHIKVNSVSIGLDRKPGLRNLLLCRSAHLYLPVGGRRSFGSCRR